MAQNNKPRHNRINGHTTNRRLGPGAIILIGLVVWALVMLDIYAADGYSKKLMTFLMVAFTLGIWGFVIFYIRPGRYGEDFYEYGFWRTIFGHKRGRNKRADKRRHKQMQRYRR